MEEVREEAGPPVKKSNRWQRVFKVLIARTSAVKKVPTSAPWARIRGRKGSRILEWGDGTRIGVLPLEAEVVFSSDDAGVHVQDGSGKSVPIGSPGSADSNRLLLMKIERALRRRGGSPGIVAAGVFLVLVLGALSAAPGLPRFSQISGAGPSAGGGDPLSSMTGLPPSMSSGLTCNVH